MCGESRTEGTKWQRYPPDSPGEWLWVEQFSCGCVVRSGVAWVPDEFDGGLDIVLPCGLPLSWEGQRASGSSDLCGITGWLKIDLPPQHWCDVWDD